MKLETVTSMTELMGTERIKFAQRAFEREKKSFQRFTVIEAIICTVVILIKFLMF